MGWDIEWGRVEGGAWVGWRGGMEGGAWGGV